MSIAVTGGAGFVGSHLCEYLVERGEDVVCIDNFWRGKEVNIAHLREKKGFEVMRGDVRDINFLNKAFEDVEIVYHLAAINGTRYFYEEPALITDVNINGTKNVLDACLKNDVKKVVFTSSSEVYGEAQIIPTPEDAVCHLDNPAVTPRHSYSASKFLGEILCSFYHSRYGLDTTSLRLFNVYGPRLIGTPYGQVVSIFIQRIMDGKAPVVFGDGTQTRSFTYVRDCVEGIVALGTADKSTGQILNLGVEHETTIMELCNLILHLMGQEDLGKESAPLPPGDCKRRCPDMSRAKKIARWEAKTSLEDGLKRTIEWFKEGRKC